MIKYKAITDTYIFEQFKGNVLESIQSTLKEGKVLTSNELKEQFVMMDKYVKSAMKPKILSALQNGEIRLMFAPEGVNRVSSIPYVMSLSNGSIIANVFVSSFGSMRQDGMVNIDYRKLYTLMEDAYIAKQFLQRYDRYKNNSAILNGCIIYANMFVKPINKKFNVHLDRNRENTLLFLAAKFYLKNVLGVQNNDIIFNTARRACKGENPLLLQEADITVPDSAYENLGSFLMALKDDRLNLGLSALTGRGFLESFISMYGGGTIFGLEMLPYFLHTVNAGISSMGLVNNYALEDIVEKGGAKIIAQFLN